MTREEAIQALKKEKRTALHENKVAFGMAIKALEQKPEIKVLERDEVLRKLGTVDIYQAIAWVELVNDLEYLGLKICEVEKNDNRRSYSKIC